MGVVVCVGVVGLLLWVGECGDLGMLWGVCFWGVGGEDVGVLGFGGFWLVDCWYVLDLYVLLGYWFGC